MTENDLEVYSFLKRNGWSKLSTIARGIPMHEEDVFQSINQLIQEEFVIQTKGKKLNGSNIPEMQFFVTDKKTDFIGEYASILRTVHQLAIKRNCEDREYRETHETDDGLYIDFDKENERREQSELLRFLNSQDMIAIRVIQTVMYLGRDYMPETEDEYYQRIENKHEDPENADQYEPPELQADDPEGLLLQMLTAHSGVSEWKDKYIEIDQIDQKIPLDKYLERSFVILGM